ncbi:O-methyltransferase domain [Arabidopsis suecica]|uniref:O-methyltransferase domain n=1 Tax=Arabidopsis suecica TaxID=45249 RepID=A0A8T1XYA5_ARASU|nr:O-methyltransferase domain [Arabidopsis suecica]
MANHLQAPLTINPKPNRTKEGQEVEEEASLLARRLSNSAAFPMVLKAALELGVIDTMATVDDCLWLSPSEIALRLPTKPIEQPGSSSFARQDASVSHQLFAQPVCKFLLNNSDVSGSFASLFMLDLSDVFIKTWTHLKDVILEGRDAFSSAHGMKLFDYIQTDERFGKVFNRAMLESSTMVMEKVLKFYEGFKDVKTLVDVGGGLGNTLGLITSKQARPVAEAHEARALGHQSPYFRAGTASKYPHLIGINFDLAPVLANAHSYPGVNNVAGDMFIKIPKGDAIFM